MQTTNTQCSYAANYELADAMVSKLLSDKTGGNDKFKHKIRSFELEVKEKLGRSSHAKHGAACQCNKMLVLFRDNACFLVDPFRVHTMKVPVFKVF